VNILYLPQRVPYPPNKGEKLRTFYQIKHLRQRDHNIFLCSPISNNSEERNLSALEERFGFLSVKQSLSPKFFRILSGLILGKPLSITNFYSNKLQKKLDDFLKKHPIDTLVCTSSSMAEYVFRSRVIPGRKKNILLLMDFMDLDSDKWNQYANASVWPMKWIYRREAILLSKYEQRIQQYFDASFFISQNEVDLLHKQIGATQNVHVLGNGIDADSFYPAEKKTNNTDPAFIFTGVMNYKPNIDAVLWFIENAWDLIRDKYPGSRFIIAGMNPSSTIQHLDRSPGIEVTGFIDDILPYYHQADYFIAPFTIARGVQNKILQAFACGLPVVTSSMGAEGIECKDGKHIIIAETGEEYLQAINKLESTPALKAKIIDAALTLIHEQYSWDGKLKALDSFLK